MQHMQKRLDVSKISREVSVQGEVDMPNAHAKHFCKRKQYLRLLNDGTLKKGKVSCD